MSSPPAATRPSGHGIPPPRGVVPARRAARAHARSRLPQALRPGGRPSEPTLFPRLRDCFADFPGTAFRPNPRGCSPWSPDAVFGTVAHKSKTSPKGQAAPTRGGTRQGIASSPVCREQMLPGRNGHWVIAGLFDREACNLPALPRPDTTESTNP